MPANEHDLNQVGHLLHARNRLCSPTRDVRGGTVKSWPMWKLSGRLRSALASSRSSKKYPRNNKAVIVFEKLKSNICACGGGTRSRSSNVNLALCWSNETLKCRHATHKGGAIHWFAPSLGDNAPSTTINHGSQSHHLGSEQWYQYNLVQC